MSFDAVNIEYAFARLIGNPTCARGTSHDADVFRSGNSKSLASALSDAVNAIEEKVASLQFYESDVESGGAKARIDVAISRLRNISETMSRSETISPEDYHWEIIGCLISTIAALLEKSRY